MINLKREYEEIKEHRHEIVEEIKELEQDEKVRKYIDLIKENNNLQKEQKSIYRSMKIDEYNNCNHILVFSKIDNDKRAGRTYTYCGCIKCGLNDAVLDETFGEEEISKLSYQEKVMHDYLTENHIWYLPGRQLHIPCDLSLAQSIYSKVIENHPGIDDNTAINYFDKALHNIRNIEVNEERKKSRAKRLSLKKNFDSWLGDDIVDNR